MKKTETKKKTVKKTSVKTVTKTPAVKKPVKSAPIDTTLLEDKDKIIEKFAQRKGDTGSPEVQIALLSHKIIKLSGHLGINKKDNHSRRGLLKVIAKRRRILNYLQKLDEKRYKTLIKELGLKR
ncbi:MAG: 30S ribosomal protein S15 [Candidatus Roizmanbacteria bacterium GW2011_GWA2_35_19]|uniref:Small ribosomal subunit protein uS15 n=2 Tax=Candidatus Roizmaniibacteriota TaxID=1752723 RepID=A0A0G0CEI5_9BACT|nr:MAG: 30S ribosomal protein S15 [Candidatus Roizmanbacteria bacterium GW2011_GWC2_35_12]KKP74496.1 MAG: 30S ribosomal protein S15 [Candidatus Roizmanbacteria bacterium GW2011_GWA2_35_19]